MKFDVVIGNPPYQIKDGGFGASASPIYQKFVTQAIDLNPRYVSMIIPSRWFAGGKGLDSFREAMLNDKRLRVLVDYMDASECFPGVKIEGGICYFLWDREHGKTEQPKCTIKNVSGDSADSKQRSIDAYDVFIRHNQAVSILEKVLAKNEISISNRVSQQKPFGLRTNFKNYKLKQFTNSYKLYARGNIGWVPFDLISVNKNLIKKWKVLISRAYGLTGSYPMQVTGKPIVAEPNSACTETYLVVNSFSTKAEAHNFAEYLKTTFCRFLISLRKNTQQLSKDKFQFVPNLDMHELWTDEKLFARYSLNDAEIAYIKSMVREMP